MTNRRSSIYVMTVSMDAGKILEHVAWMNQHIRPQDSVGWKMLDETHRDVFMFGFRSPDDTAAYGLATIMADDHEFRLYTGLGVNRREVTRDGVTA